MSFKHHLSALIASIALALPASAQLYGRSLTFETGFNIKHMDRLDVFAIVKPVGPLRLEVRQWTGPFGTEMNRSLRVGVQDVEIVNDSTRSKGTKLTAIVPPYDGFESRFQEDDSKFLILGFEGNPGESVIMPDESLGFELKMNFGTGVKEDSAREWVYGRIERKSPNEFCLLSHFTTNIDTLPVHESIRNRWILAMESSLSSTTQPEFTRLIYLLGLAYFPNWEGSVLDLGIRSGIPSSEVTMHIMGLAKQFHGYRKAKLIEILVQKKVLGTVQEYYNALVECKDEIHAFEEEGIPPIPNALFSQPMRQGDPKPWLPDANSCAEAICAAKNTNIRSFLLWNLLSSDFNEVRASKLAQLIPKLGDLDLRFLLGLLAIATNDIEHRPGSREDIYSPWINKEECIRYWMEKYHVSPS